ncbi:hypothetical protein P8C59_009613 [Phyllachora maydis]|uniref:Arp2/3 complex 20 kDa n=1 Tax=Phyllachora maydis TaxID=1825666 RepID=A0AAD9IED5_9PEZI|nr:hypothetical protein P8C59_009613 [Phyllachora maydis]
MSQSLRPYLLAVRSSLTAALCLSNFASQTAERHNVPEIEAQTSPEVLLNPLTVARNENERVLLEPSINSVRISIRIKQADEIEHILVHKFTRFLTQRAENFFVLRRKPIPGYDISFLITNFHTEEMLKHKLVDFVIHFMEEVDKEISEMKLFLNARARFVAESFLTPFDYIIHQAIFSGLPLASHSYLYLHFPRFHFFFDFRRLVTESKVRYASSLSSFHKLTKYRVHRDAHLDTLRLSHLPYSRKEQSDTNSDFSTLLRVNLFYHNLSQRLPVFDTGDLKLKDTMSRDMASNREFARARTAKRLGLSPEQLQQMPQPWPRAAMNNPEDYEPLTPTAQSQYAGEKTKHFQQEHGKLQSYTQQVPKPDQGRVYVPPGRRQTYSKPFFVPNQNAHPNKGIAGPGGIGNFDSLLQAKNQAMATGPTSFPHSGHAGQHQGFASNPSHGYANLDNSQGNDGFYQQGPSIDNGYPKVAYNSYANNTVNTSGTNNDHSGYHGPMTDFACPYTNTNDLYRVHFSANAPRGSNTFASSSFHGAPPTDMSTSRDYNQVSKHHHHGPVGASKPSQKSPPGTTVQQLGEMVMKHNLGTSPPASRGSTDVHKSHPPTHATPGAMLRSSPAAVSSSHPANTARGFDGMAQFQSPNNPMTTQLTAFSPAERLPYSPTPVTDQANAHGRLPSQQFQSVAISSVTTSGGRSIFQPAVGNAGQVAESGHDFAVSQAQSQSPATPGQHNLTHFQENSQAVQQQSFAQQQSVPQIAANPNAAYHKFANAPLHPQQLEAGAMPAYVKFFPTLGESPAHIKALRSRVLNKLTAGPLGQPTVEMALHHSFFPFVESASMAEPKDHGVVRISNIPFSTTRAEVVAILGRNSRMLNDEHEGVHIVMDRVNGKTQDAFVEFMTLDDAVKAVNRYRESNRNLRPVRIGKRPIEMTLSSMDELMANLFPRATGVKWVNGRVTIPPKKHSMPHGDFKGFITAEEMTMLVKHVEDPQRTPFSQHCPQRAFECMISTVVKLPWYETKLIKLFQRNAVHKSMVELIQLLDAAIEADPHHLLLNQQLKRRLIRVGLNCPGFSICQKDDYAYFGNLTEGDTRRMGLPRDGFRWRHAYTLRNKLPKAQYPLDLVEYYIALIREGTSAVVEAMPKMQSKDIVALGKQTELYFGYLFWEMNIPRTGQEIDQLTLHRLAEMEMEAIEAALRRRLTVYPGQIPKPVESRK